MVDDPIVVLRNHIQQQVSDGYTFEGVTLNIATELETVFFSNPNGAVAGPTVPVTIPQFEGGAENILFLFDPRTTPPSGNAETAVIYATFWIEKVTSPHHGLSFMQLQYAQMVTSNFPVASALALNAPRLVNLGWPHITVATLLKVAG